MARLCAKRARLDSQSMSISDDLARIALQEQQLRFSAFDEQTAWRLGSRLRSLAVERGLVLVIDIRRVAQPLFFAALPGTTPDNAEWVRRKSNVVFRFQRSSYAIGLEMEQKQSTLQDRYGLLLADYACHGGSFPVRARGAGFLGAVTVSGLPQRDDHNLVIEALCAELGADYAALRLE
ncbi:MAG TPA: heme-degrading domain-containing protein [Acidobacteriaceae bacterium]|nr:heme-degrading domain-containing protein [Acidobacteriaceae bacterium]